MPRYEMVFIVQPELDEEAAGALIEKISQTITSLGGDVQELQAWGRRRLAYTIQRYREGFYYLVHMEFPAEAVRSLERSLKLMEDVIRHLIVRKDESAAA
jgi:small subunit ribosomal protein S6